MTHADSSGRQLLLVHGGWMDARCWDLLLPHLARAGITAHTITLPGNGDTPTSAFSASMARSADAICEKLARIGTPTILLGHSMGGYSITAAAEKAPELVSRMIYLSAWVPPMDGRSMAGTDAKFGSVITGPRVKPAVKWRPLRGVIDLDPARGPSFLCQLADQEAQSFLMSVTNPQPIRPGLSRVRWSEARLGRIPKIYVECTQDEAIPLDGQRHFQANATFADVLSMDSDHAPQVSMPAALADVISQAMG